MIKTENLCFSYGKKQVLYDINILAEKGKISAVLGKNGVGKTTLFRCILGLLTDYSGRITISDKQVGAMSAKQIALQIAYIPQVHYPSFHYSVLDMVLMGTGSRVFTFSTPKKEQYEAAQGALQKAGIEHLADRDYCRISGGEQQLVLIARALAQQTPILLMDEPTSSLDYGNQIRIMEQTRKLSNEGYTVLMSSHNPQHVLSYCDHAVALKGGTVLHSGTPEQTISPELMSELYEVKVTIEDLKNTKVILPVSD